MKRWTTREIRYLEDHAFEGAEQIAEALGRSVASVQWQASQYGISLRMRWCCPRCGSWVHKPLSSRTGWCVACTRKDGIARTERDIEQMRRETAEERSLRRMQQAAYARKSRLVRKEAQ